MEHSDDPKHVGKCEESGYGHCVLVKKDDSSLKAKDTFLVWHQHLILRRTSDIKRNVETMEGA